MHKYIFCRHTNTYSYGYTNNISADPKLHKKGGRRTNTKRKYKLDLSKLCEFCIKNGASPGVHHLSYASLVHSSSSYLTSLSHIIFKNMAHVGSFSHFAFVFVFVFVFVCVFVIVITGASVDSRCHKLSENIWFMWSERS